MKRRVVYLQDNMLNEHGREIFQADIPYVVDGIDGNSIENEDGLQLSINQIWVDFHLFHQSDK